MNKRITLSALLIMVAIALLAGLHNYYQPKPAPLVLINYARSISIPFENAEKEIASSTGRQYYWFCDGSVNCHFLNDNVLRPLADEIKASEFPEFTFVDMSNIRKDISPGRLKATWGFSAFPAFVALEYKDNKIVIHSVLEWRNSAPIGRNELRNWMIENGIWRGVR